MFVSSEKFVEAHGGGRLTVSASIVRSTKEIASCSKITTSQ
jgi:hypothetical protein